MLGNIEIELKEQLSSNTKLLTDLKKKKRIINQKELFYDLSNQKKKQEFIEKVNLTVEQADLKQQIIYLKKKLFNKQNNESHKNSSIRKEIQKFKFFLKNLED